MQSILLIGVTSAVGSRIAYDLINQPNVELSLFVHPNARTDPMSRAIVLPLHKRGARIIHGSFTDKASVDRAMTDSDTVIYMESNDLDGNVKQAALIEAAKKNGVQRVLVTNWNFDVTLLQQEIILLDIRKLKAKQRFTQLLKNNLRSMIMLLKNSKISSFA